MFSQDCRATVVRHVHETFATSSRYMKILTTLARHSHECRAKVCQKIRKTVARNSHASEILGLLCIKKVKMILSVQSKIIRITCLCNVASPLSSKNRICKDLSLISPSFSTQRVGEDHPPGLLTNYKGVLCVNKKCIHSTPLSH